MHLEWMSLLYQALWLFLHYDQNIQSDDFILGNRPIGISKILTMVYQNSHYLYVLSNHHYAVLCTCMNILQSVKSVKYCSVLFSSFLFFFSIKNNNNIHLTLFNTILDATTILFLSLTRTEENRADHHFVNSVCYTVTFMSEQFRYVVFCFCLCCFSAKRSIFCLMKLRWY